MNYREHPEDINWQKYWLILKRHWFPSSCIFILTVMAALIAALAQEEIYQASGKLKFKKQDTTSALVTELGEKLGQLESLKFINTPLDTEAQVVGSYPIVTRTIEELNLSDRKDDEPVTYEAFLKNLSIQNIAGTDVLLVAYKSPDQREAKKIVDRLMKIYIENNIAVNRTEAEAARKFISQQLPKTEKNLLEAEAALGSFKQKYNTVNLDTESQLKVEQIAELNEQIDQNQALLAQLTARIDQLENRLGFSAEKALALNAVSDSEDILETIKQLQLVKNQLAKERSRFTELNPVVIDLEQEKASLEALLRQQAGEDLSRDQQTLERFLQTGDIKEVLAQDLVKAEVQRQEIIEQQASLQQTVAEYTQRVNQIPELEQQQRNLERKLDAAQTAYKALLNNLQQVAIAENQNVGNAHIINPAIIEEYPVSVSKKLILGGGIVTGGILAIIAAFLLEIIDPSVKTSKALRNLFQYSVLGLIPSSEKKARLSARRKTEYLFAPERQIVEAPHSPSAEAYKMLQANLKFLCLDQNVKVIVVSSSVAQEGKSTVSANLAAVLAELGNRVLLIDGDLHQPTQHQIWQLNREVGFSNIIYNREQLTKAIAKVKPNLDVIPSGLIPPNTLALLESKETQSLIENFKSSYDYIIIDTPPLLLFADALTLSKTADGIILVARPGVTQTASAAAAEELLQKSGQNVLGLVVNGVVTEHEPDSYLAHTKTYYHDDNSKRRIGEGV